MEVDAAPPAALHGLGGVDLDDLEAVLGPVDAVAARGHRRDVLEVLLLAQEEGGGGGVRRREERGREEVLGEAPGREEAGALSQSTRVIQ